MAAGSRIAQKFAKDSRGNVALMFGLALPVLAVLVLSLIDYERSRSTRHRLQMAADSAALAASKELVLANSDPQKIAAIAQQIAMAGLGTQDASASVTAAVLSTNDGVQVTIDEDLSSASGGISVFKKPHMQVSATAHLSGGSTVCLLALDPAISKGLALDSSMLTSPQCGSYANSTDKDAIDVGGTAFIKSGMVCSGGGVNAMQGAVQPSPVLDCPNLKDPLASRPPPSVNGCDYTNTVLHGGPQTLMPGVYCGGIVSGNGSKVTMANGTFIIKDGPLQFGKNSTLTMQNAGVYLTGTNAVLAFDNTTSLNLSAPVSGPMAGILFFEDRTVLQGQQHYISSRAADMLLGTIYLPRNTLVVGEKPTKGSPVAFNCAAIPGYTGQCPPAAANIGAASAWTVVIANQIMINAGVNLVLNANYGVSSVPAPPEIVSNASATARLIQ